MFLVLDSLIPTKENIALPYQSEGPIGLVEYSFENNQKREVQPLPKECLTHAIEAAKEMGWLP